MKPRYTVSMQAFILAGGFATRLWPLTEKRCKPLLPLAGPPILSHVIEAVPHNMSVTVSTNAVFERDMRAWAKQWKGRSIKVLVEDTAHDDHKLGALGAIAKWITEEKIDDDVLLLAGDNYSAADMPAFLALFRGNPTVAAHDIGDLDQARRFGTIVLSDESEGQLKRVMNFEEKPEHPKSTCVSTGWWIIPKAALPILTEYAKGHPDNVGGIFEEFLRRNMTVDCYVYRERWKDIGSFESYLAAHREVLDGKQMVDPHATVDKDSTLKGSVSIGPKVAVQRSTLTDCIIFGNSTIDDCVLTECIIDTGCTLKGIDLTGKMLRAGTVLKQ